MPAFAHSQARVQNKASLGLFWFKLAQAMPVDHLWVLGHERLGGDHGRKDELEQLRRHRLSEAELRHDVC